MDQSLAVFIAVAEKRNFTRAAEALHMTQPAVSQYIQALERTAGAALLERTNKYVRLTKAGEIVYHHAKEIAGLHERMLALVADLMHVPGGALTIGASYTFGEYVLPHVIAGLHERYPAIQPAITIGNSTEIAAGVREQRLDVGVIEGRAPEGGLITEPFAEDRLEIVAAADHPLAGDEAAAAGRLSAQTWIVRESGSGTREAADAMLRELGIVPERLMEFGSTQIIKESVEAGLGVSFLSQWAVRKELALGTLRIVKAAGREAPFARRFSIVTRETPFRTKAAEAFIGLLRSGDWLAKGRLP
ncbi:LysR family transcriptional regulator [Paenibacillus humicola]|uniref:LysR family transcriptional regulator n=1 Tax=Paenibacillus humicola TaxID=3110540 RepID=UPI00237C278F|nr:LysR family transcriptional regulator [Paenibacillus humicola]